MAAYLSLYPGLPRGWFSSISIIIIAIRGSIKAASYMGIAA
jgi:hypothetical protein